MLCISVGGVTVENAAKEHRNKLYGRFLIMPPNSDMHKSFNA